MSALGSADIQDSATARLASQSDQLVQPSALPPFCGKLNMDEKLKLSREDFKQLIENSFNTNITPLSQLTATPPFPTPHVLAQFASKAYTDYKTGETDAQYETRLALPDGWKLLTTASNNNWNNSYFGAAYWHPQNQQVVIAHRGTKLKMLGALWADVVGVVFKHHVAQMDSASSFADKVVDVLREVKREHQVSFQLFFTGHSLGGWLAQVTTFTTEYLKKEESVFLKSNHDHDCLHPHTVVFESPGCKDMLLQMRRTFDVRLDGCSIDIEHLDITSYLSAPNRINTCNEHVGTVYRIFPDLSDMGLVTSRRGTVYNIFPYLSDTVLFTGIRGIVFCFFLYLLDTIWQIKHFPLYTLVTHSMDKIVAAFDPETGQVHKNEQSQLEIHAVVDWPISTGLRGGEEYKKFFEWAQKFKNYLPDIADESFQHLHYCPIRYQTKLYDERVNSLSVFSQEEQEFLKTYSRLRQWPEFCNPKELFAVMEDNQAQEQAGKILHSFEIEKDTIRCTDDSALQTLIPYVKRLLQLFPQMKEIKNRVLQCETRFCVQRIRESPLEFNSDASSFREFLESEQQKVLHLGMLQGNEWIGLIKVYQLLRKVNCLMEDQYTVLRLESLLTLNKLLDFSTLKLSGEATYLMLVVCEATEQLKAETEDVIRKTFEKMKQKPLIKIILTTRSEYTGAHILQRIGREIFGNGFVTRAEQLTWSDLTSSSQEKLLEKSVQFQGAKISLNELMSAESVVANLLPLGALLEEKEINIADPVPVSTAYNERYYIGRTLRQQKAIKQDIFNDKNVKEKHVFLANTNQDFEQLCQLYPNSNVHWLEKDKSGKLVWQQSQGSLETLRKYIDTKSSYTYTPDDLDKLLEQAQHQRLMLISDAAGMGKSTILTHLSKQIKQKFPEKWVVRIDLNDHTDALKALKEELIDKEKAIAFVAEKLLKLKPGLEVEIFKLCCEQKQETRTVIILDGFDEISPFYKQTVIDLLQALRQSAVEQLWVTTRPHLRENLEDKVQQLSYTLEPFSEKNQVEFLTKFWSPIDWFTETNDKEEEKEKRKLEIYAEHLIRNLAYSISDKDRQFTGIPLQTRMLAEAFDKEVKIFYQSAESMPELQFQIDLIGLYDRFIERKYDIYLEEKLQVSVNNVAAIQQRERELKCIRKDHQVLAWKMLFSEEPVALTESKSDCTFSVEELTRIGIVQVIHDGKPHFVHRTFAEYYVADCLVNRLTERNDTSEEIVNFILKDIFLEKDYEVIRVFVDGLLSRSKLKLYDNRIQDLREYGDKILHIAAFEGNTNIIAFLLDSLLAGDHTDTVNKLLLGRDKKGLTAWNIAVISNNTQVLEKVWKYAEEKLTVEDLKNKLLLAGVLKEYNSLDREIYDSEFSWLKDANLTLVKMAYDNCIDYGSTNWHLAAMIDNLEVIQKLWEWANKKLTREEINNKMLLATDKARRTVWHVDAQFGKLETLQKVWEWATENLTKEDICKFLLATDKEGRTVWHVAARWGKLETLQKIWQWAKEKLTKEEVNNKLLLVTDKEGNTPLHLAEMSDNLEVLQKVWEWAKENITTKQINKMLLDTDGKGNTVLHVAAKWENLKALQKVWEWAKEKLNTEERNKLLFATDKEGRTALHWAAKTGSLDILQKLWELFQENLTADEINNKLLLATDKQGRNLWHVAAERGNLETLQKVWEWAKKKLTKEEISYFLLATDKEGRTVWHMAARWGNLELLQKLWEWATEELKTEEIRKLLLATDEEGKTVWHVAAQSDKLETLLNVWEWAKEKLNAEEIKHKLLLATDKEGNTTLHFTEMWTNLETLQKVWEWAKEKLTKEELNKLLLATDKEGRTVWHLAAQMGNLRALLKVWEWAKEKLNVEEVKYKLLLATDNEESTILHSAANGKYLEILQKVWEWVTEKLTAEEINKKMLSATDKRGRTVWHVAANCGKLDTLHKVWELAKEKITTEEINRMLLTTDKEGMTVLHLAAHWGNLETLQNVWE